MRHKFKQIRNWWSSNMLKVLERIRRHYKNQLLSGLLKLCKIRMKCSYILTTKNLVILEMRCHMPALFFLVHVAITILSMLLLRTQCRNAWAKLLPYQCISLSRCLDHPILKIQDSRAILLRPNSKMIYKLSLCVHKKLWRYGIIVALN